MSEALKRIYVEGFNYSDLGSDGLKQDGIGSNSQMPSWNNPEYQPTDFVWWDPDNSPGPFNKGSAFFRGDCEIPTHTSTVTTTRVEHSISSSSVQFPWTEASEVWQSISYYTPEDYESDPNYDVIGQWHGGSMSPPVSIRRVNGRLSFDIWGQDGWISQQVMDVGPAEPGKWTHFVIYMKWADDLTGQLTVWRDGKLARLHSPTGEPWVVPHQTSPGVTTNWIIKPAMGDLPYTVDEGGQEVSVLDWRGRISHIGGGIMPDKYFKCGIYKSSITRCYVPGNGLREGWNIPGHEYFIPEVSRITRIGVGNLNLETRVDELSHIEIYKSLDVNRSAPIEFPEWWIDEPTKPVPFKRIYQGNSFLYNQAQNDTPDSNGRLPDDTLGSTGNLPNRPPGLDLSETVYMDSFVKRTPRVYGSAKCIADINKRWYNSDESYKTFRYQHTVTSPQLKTNEVWGGFSIYFAPDYVPDGKTNLFYNYGGVGGGAWSIRETSGYFYIQFSRGDENTTSNRMVALIGKSTPGMWHDFVFFARWSPLTSEGRLTIWKNGELARLLHPVTKEPWEVNTEVISGIQPQYTAFPAKGQFVKKIIKDGKTIDLFDWEGFTLGKGVGGEQIDHNFRTGWYYSGWNSNLNTSTDELYPGTFIEGDPLYIAPEFRTRDIWIHVEGWQPVDSPMGVLSHDTIFKSLHPDGITPSQDEVPDWYVSDAALNITSPQNGQQFELAQTINVVTDAEDGEVELLINDKVRQVKSGAPYNFSIEAGTIDINDSVLNLKFENDLFDESTENNQIIPNNPENIQYVEGVRGQAISMGMGVEGNDRAFLTINPGPKLSNLNGPFTISYYVKGESGFSQQLFGNGSSSYGGVYAYVLSDGRTDFFIVSTSGTYTLRSIEAGSNTRLSPDYFGHFAWVYDGDWLRCYYNSVQTNSVQIGAIEFPTTFPQFLINSRPNSSRGQLVWDDFRVYDYAIAEEDIYKTVEDNYLGQLEIKVRRAGVESNAVTVNVVDEIPDDYDGPYYVSNNGDDNNEGSVSEPVQTIDKVNEILSEGITNSVSFNRGDIFEDGLEIPTVNDGTISDPIEFKPYGSGNTPVLSGFKPIGSFTNVSSNIYQVQDDNFPDYIYKVMLGGSNQPKGRLPREGWLRADSNNNNSITSTNLPSVNYSGGQVEAVIWKMQWVQDTVKVTGRTGDTLNYTGGSSYPSSPRTDGRYYIQNAVECLTEQGDWMYDTNTKTLTIYSSVDPNTLSIAYSSEKDGIEGIGNTYNSYSELSLEGSINGVDLEGSNNNTVSGLVISNQTNEGIAVRNSANVVVSDNEISDADVRGISFTNTSASPVVIGNKVYNIALNTGNPLANGDEKGNGIHFSNSENIDCQLNEVTGVGFNGIRYNHNNALIARNLVDGFCLTKHDGSGIYTYGGGSGVNTHTGRFVVRNIVTNGGDPLRPNTYGIYVDDNSENITHSGNLIKNIWNAGHYIHNSHDLSYDGDIIYGCGTLFKFGQDGSNELIRNNTISNNVFVVTSKSNFGFEILSNANDISSFFNSNNNIYIVASNRQLVFTTRYVDGGKTYLNNVDFAGWQALGNDVDSQIRYLDIPEYNIVSEGSNKWNGTVGNYHQDGEVTVNVDGSNVEILMTSQSPTTTRAEIHFRLNNVESDKDYIVRFRARALSGHQSLNLYMRQSNAPYRDLGGKTAAVVGSEWEEFEFLVSDLIDESLAGYLIDCQSNQGTLEIQDFEFVEVVVNKTNYEDYILPVSNISPNSDIVEVGSGWRNLDGEETSSVELESFESTILLSDGLPTEEYTIEVTQTTGGNVTGGGTYEEGEEVTLTATPDTGYRFVRWSNNVTSNPYTFTAVGSISISAIFEEVGIEGPAAEITSPENNSLFTQGDPIEIEVNVEQGDNPIDRVELYVGGNLLSTIESSPYEYIWEDASPGIYTLTARAIDISDNVGMSSPILITVQDGPDPEPGYFTVNIKFNIV